MYKLFEKLIDIIFPRRCPVCDEVLTYRSGLICEKCERVPVRIKDPFCIICGKPLKETQKVCCKICSEGKITFDEGRSVFLYDDAMRKSMYRFKYGDRREYARFYAEEIYKNLYHKINEWEPQVIIPVPIHKSKLKKRGYNQAYLIAKELSNLTKIPVDDKIITRNRKTEIQKNLGVSDRTNNLKNAFKMNGNGVQYISTMLIDDIFTTGATMCSISSVLKDAGVPRVFCISVCIGRDS